MGLSKLLEKLGDMLKMESETKKKYRKKLKILLKDLKVKENKLKQKLEASTDERKRDRLEKELYIVHGQRIKGIEALRRAKKRKRD